MLATRFALGLSLAAFVTLATLATGCGKIDDDDPRTQGTEGTGGSSGSSGSSGGDSQRFATSCVQDADCIIVLGCNCAPSAFSRTSGARNKTNEECGLPPGASGAPCAGAEAVCNAGTCEACSYRDPRCVPPPGSRPPPGEPPPTPDG